MLTPRITSLIFTRMIFGVIFTLLGAQIISIGAFAKVFSYAERFDRKNISLRRALDARALGERALARAAASS